MFFGWQAVQSNLNTTHRLCALATSFPDKPEQNGLLFIGQLLWPVDRLCSGDSNDRNQEKMKEDNALFTEQPADNDCFH